jgi:hypothetical protein
MAYSLTNHCHPMHYLLLLIVLFCQTAIYSQVEFKKIDREEVKKAISNKDANTYYPKLLERFLHDDTTLSLEDCRLLYYGFVFQDKYSGYPGLKQKEINEALSKKDNDLAIKLCDEVLAEYPINLFGNYNKAVALYRKNQSDSDFRKYGNRYSRIMNAIISSGDGLTCSTSFKTIFVNDEYMVMYNYFEIPKHQSQSLEMPCDKMSITPSQYFKAENMFFDTSETFISMQKLFDKK